MKFIIKLLFLSLSIIGYSQNTTYAKHILDTLTSPYFEGRGALNDGEKKAALFIANEYERLGLKPYKSSFFQHFNYPINTIYGDLAVTIDGKKLIAGVDFIIEGNSGKINGTFNLVHYNALNLPTKKTIQKLAKKNFFTTKIIVVDEKDIEPTNEVLKLLKLNLIGAEGVVSIKEKLTKGLSSTYENHAILAIKKGKITRKNHSITLTINQKLLPNYLSQNVIGYIQGTDFPDSIIAITAHYDHLGKMGDTVYFPGANDNGSGIALLLNLAEHYALNKPKKTIVFMAFGGEEAGILGSAHFIKNPLFTLNHINFLINVDVIGTGDEGLMVVNGVELAAAFDQLNNLNAKKAYLPEIKKRKNAPNSDHYWFAQKNIPAFFIYGLGGRKAYHDVDDIASTLPMPHFENIFCYYSAAKLAKQEREFKVF